MDLDQKKQWKVVHPKEDRPVDLAVAGKSPKKVVVHPDQSLVAARVAKKEVKGPNQAEVKNDRADRPSDRPETSK